MYGKVFESIYDGTLAGHWQAIVTMQQLIVLASADGVVDVTPEAIARRTTIPLEIITAGIEHLLKPDPHSRSPEEDGRRIVPIDERRPWGWRLVNHEKYRNLTSIAQKREGDRDRMAAVRAGEHKKRQGYVYFAAAGADGPIKIGYSANPWSRLEELQTGSPQRFELLGVIVGSDADERSWHTEFAALRIHGEWFKRSPTLIKRIKEMRHRSSTTVNDDANVAHTDTDTEADTKAKSKAIAPSASRSTPPDPSEVVEKIPLCDGTEHPVTKTFVAELDRLYPAVDPVQTLREIRGWCLGNPRRTKTARGVKGFITSWFGREQDKHSARAS